MTNASNVPRPFSNSGLEHEASLKTPAQIAKIARAGQLVATVHAALGAAIHNGVRPVVLDRLATRIIEDAGGQTMADYRIGSAPPFGAAISVSINHHIAHVRPYKHHRLATGDIVTIDLVAAIDGWWADAAVTHVVGGLNGVSNRKRQLVAGTRRALDAGVAAAGPGVSVSDVTAAIHAVAREHRLGVVRRLTGHGIGRAIHEEPRIPNHESYESNVVLEVGHVIAIEPILTLAADGGPGAEDFSVVGRRQRYEGPPGSYSAHFEHTLAITADGARVLTAPAYA